MIKVNVYGKNYVLDFAYSMDERAEMNSGRITKAMLFEDLGNKKDQNYSKPDYIGVAIKHPKDQDVKENARKAAIRKLVSRFDYETRSSVWAAYFAR
jgi:hypothetical protein